MRYILGVKEGDHKFLFQFVDQAAEKGEAVELTIADTKDSSVTHCFRIVYNAPLNKSNQDRRVTFVEYWEDNPKKKRQLHFSWITDLEVKQPEVYTKMVSEG